MNPETALLKRSVEARLDEALAAGPKPIEEMVEFISKAQENMRRYTRGDGFTVPKDVFDRMAKYAELGMQLVLFKVSQANEGK